MAIRGAIGFILVSESGIKDGDGIVTVHRVDGSGSPGSLIMAELQKEMLAREIQHTVTIPFTDRVEDAIERWVRPGRNILEKIVVICSDHRRESVARGTIKCFAVPIALWTFDGRHEPEISWEKYRYFPDVYPRELMPENDGIQRMLQAMEEERWRSTLRSAAAVFFGG